MKNFKFILPGTAALFPTIVGVLRGCEELGIQFDAWGGTSGGALMSAVRASGYKNSHEMEALIKELGPILGKTIRPSIRGLLNDGVLDTRHLRKALKKYLVPKLGDAEIPTRIITTNMNASKASEASRVWCSEKDKDASLPDLVAASTAMQFIFPPVQVGNELHNDGGWLRNFAADLWGDNKQVIGVSLGGSLSGFKLAPWYRPITRRFQILMRLIDLQIAHNIHEDVSDAPNIKTFRVRTTHPSLDFDLTEDKIDMMIQDGLRAVREQADELL